MTTYPNDDLIFYTFKKNHLKIYSEFLNFQSLGLTQKDNSEAEHFEKSLIENESQLNIRNFNALYWITLYLKNIKKNSLNLIHKFFIFKNWTTWSEKNFSYHYYKICKQEKTKNEIEQMQRLIDLEDAIEFPERKIEPTIAKHQPKILGGDQSTKGKPVIDMYASAQELIETALAKRDKYATKI